MRFCTNCKRPVDFSICVLASTNRISPRRQKSSRSVPFCAACIAKLCSRDGENIPPSLHRALKSALTALTVPSRKRLNGVVGR